MGKILIENMEFFAHHGHYKEEQISGNRFIVTLEIDTDIEKAAVSDDLGDTLDYQKAYEIIKKEMAITSHLHENVAGRTLKNLKKEFHEQINHTTITISKINPPLGGKVDKVTVKMSS